MQLTFIFKARVYVKWIIYNLSGTLSGIKYFIWGMNEPDNMLKIMGQDGVFMTYDCKEAQRNELMEMSHTQQNLLITSPFTSIFTIAT